MDKKPKDKPEKQPPEPLTKQEWTIIINLLYSNRWTVEETQKAIVPLINKCSKWADEV